MAAQDKYEGAKPISKMAGTSTIERYLNAAARRKLKEAYAETDDNPKPSDTLTKEQKELKRLMDEIDAYLKEVRKISEEGDASYAEFDRMRRVRLEPTPDQERPVNKKILSIKDAVINPKQYSKPIGPSPSTDIPIGIVITGTDIVAQEDNTVAAQSKQNAASQGATQGPPMPPDMQARLQELQIEAATLQNKKALAELTEKEILNQNQAMQFQMASQLFQQQQAQASQPSPLAPLISRAVEESRAPTFWEQLANVGTLGFSGALGLTQTTGRSERGQDRLMQLIHLQNQSGRGAGSGLFDDLMKAALVTTPAAQAEAARVKPMDTAALKRLDAIKNGIRDTSLQFGEQYGQLPPASQILYSRFMEQMSKMPPDTIDENMIQSAASNAIRDLAKAGQLAELPNAYRVLESSFGQFTKGLTEQAKVSQIPESTSYQTGVGHVVDSFRAFRERLGQFEQSITAEAAKAAPARATAPQKDQATALRDLIVSRGAGTPEEIAASEKEAAARKAARPNPAGEILEARRQQKNAERPVVSKLVAKLSKMPERAADILMQILDHTDGVQRVDPAVFAVGGYSEAEAATLAIVANQFLTQMRAEAGNLTLSEYLRNLLKEGGVLQGAPTKFIDIRR